MISRYWRTTLFKAMASYSYMYITLSFFNQYVLHMTHCNRKKHASVVILWITIFKQKTVNHVFTTYNFKCENYINEYLIQKGFTEYNSHYLKKSTFTVKKTKYMIVNSIALMLKEKWHSTCCEQGTKLSVRPTCSIFHQKQVF